MYVLMTLSEAPKHRYSWKIPNRVTFQAHIVSATVRCTGQPPKWSFSKHRSKGDPHLNEWMNKQEGGMGGRWSSSLQPPKKVDQMFPFDDVVQVTVTFLWHSKSIEVQPSSVMMHDRQWVPSLFYLERWITVIQHTDEYSTTDSQAALQLYTNLLEAQIVSATFTYHTCRQPE